MLDHDLILYSLSDLGRSYYHFVGALDLQRPFCPFSAACNNFQLLLNPLSSHKPMQRYMYVHSPSAARASHCYQNIRLTFYDVSVSPALHCSASLID